MVVLGLPKFMVKHYEKYCFTNVRTLVDCYYRHSEAKERAYRRCLQRMEAYNGFNERITSWNNNVFTFAFTGYYNGRKSFFVITKDYMYYIPLNMLSAF